MDSEQQAWDALRTISQAETAARRRSQNNGIVPLVWGVSLLVAMTGFDAALRLAADPDMGILAAGMFCGVLSAVTAAWTSQYQRRLPVQPRTLDRPRLYFWWVLYHTAIVFGGIALGHGLARLQHQHCVPAGTFTLIGLLDAAPLLWVGWQQRRACGGLR